jgi:2-dehydro-3-deoxyphosphogluconate aldolase / (4S)-4-hydroxy-2-oxoglutarate aldolase
MPFARLSQIGIVPVVVVDNPEHALPLADALSAGGVPLIEVTFRTQAAAEVIRLIRSNRPDVIVGAGTVISAENLRAAVDAGAQFGVAPGCNPQVVSLATSVGLPFIPGVCTPSEIEIAMSLRCPLLKFFPCEAAGGFPFLNAIATPFRHTGVKFMPSGGITPGNLEKYLASDLVSSVGGTWLAKPDDLAGGRWEAIQQRCQEAIATLRRVRAAK